MSFLCNSQALKPSSTAFSSILAGSCIQSGAARTRTDVYMGCWHHIWWLYLLCHNAHLFLKISKMCFSQSIQFSSLAKHKKVKPYFTESRIFGTLPKINLLVEREVGC